MNNGLYSAMLGMRARQRALDVIANNIANASTTGFKADRLRFSTFEVLQLAAQTEAQSGNQKADSQTPVGASPNARSAASSAVMASSATDFSTGPMRETGRPLDVALDGDGFLVVQTERGQRYTRAGSLTLNSNGQLVTQKGDLVVGAGGAVTLPPGEASIGEDGTISVKGQQVGRLQIVRFEDVRASLLKDGDSLFVATGTAQPVEATGTRVMQGALESSNVNPLSEMVAMMQNNREFDSLQRSVSLMMNDIGRKIAGEIGKI